MALDEATPVSGSYSGYSTLMNTWNAFNTWLGTAEANYVGSTTKLYTGGASKQVLCVFTPFKKPMEGKLALIKSSANTAITNGNSCYSLKGAVYDVFNSSGTKVGSITTDENGKGSIDGLQAGTGYYIIEKKAPKGYALDSSKHTFKITAGQTTTVKVSDKPQNDPVTMLIKKLNKTTGTAERLGDGSLAGAQFTVKYYDGYYTKADLPSAADRTWVLKTDENGRTRLAKQYIVSGSDLYYASNGDPCLPLGTITIQETKAPAGFKIDNTLHLQQITSSATTEGVIAFNEITVNEEEFFGKIELQKMAVDGESKAPEEGAEFEIYLTSAGSYANAKDEERDYLKTGADGRATSKELPYGNYTIHQVSGKDSYQLAADKTVSITTDNSVVPISFDNLKMEIGTSASDENGQKILNVATDITIIDTVSYTNLNVGKEYKVKGVLMDKQTGEPILIDGEKVTGETTFTPETADGSVEVSFSFNGIPLKGKTVVVFETLYEGEKEVAVHADIEDEGQTIEFTEPKIGTTATVESEKEAIICAETILIDTVEYENLTPGKEYAIKGILMDKQTGEPILVDGEKVIAEKQFTADEANGTIDMTFTFNSLALKGKSVVVFETIYENDVEVITHGDINDEGQTVRFLNPTIATQAHDENGKKLLEAAKDITIVDTVSYTDLKPGKEYLIKGVLMDKQTGEPLLIDEKQITSETTFTPEKADGSIEVRFTVDTSGLRGKSIVVFEELYYEEILLAAHADIENEGQTVTVKTPPPKTGDSADMIPWILIMAVSGAAVIVIAYIGKKSVRKQ